MMKNKKGFTLVELIVAIALVISITVIAVVSITNISKKNKEQAYELVKEQVENAAEEYFNNNEYLFEGLKDSTVGYISVGRLVNEGLLNSVVDPRSGRKINECALVKVTKENDAIDINFDGLLVDNKKCNNDNSLVILMAGAPEGDILYYDKNNKELNYQDWFNIANLGENSKLKVCVKANTKGNGKIKSAVVAGNEVSNMVDNKYCADINDDKIYENLEFSLVNVYDKTWEKRVTIRKDTVKPYGIVNVLSNAVGYNNKVVNIAFHTSDNTSGVSKVKYNNISYTSFNKSDLSYQKKITLNNINISNNLDGSRHSITANVYDNAGNIGNLNSNDYYVYQNCTEKINGTPKKKFGECTKKCGGGTQSVIEEYEITDKYTNASCRKGTNELPAQNCNDFDCCSSTSENNIDYGTWSSCSSSCNGTKTRTNTKYLVSAYDKNVSCGTETIVESKPCNEPGEINFVFDDDATNKSISTKNKKNIFPNKTGIYKYDKVIKPIILNFLTYDLGCKDCKTSSGNKHYYIGQACENVVDYKRYFKVDGKQVYIVGDNSYKGNGCPSGKNCISTYNSGIGSVIAWVENKRYGCFNDASINEFSSDCGSKTGFQPDFTEWHFKFVPDCGDVSENEIILYTKYSVDCNY